MYQYHTLSNGIRIVLSHTTSRVVYSGVFVGIGSRDELGADEGLAHFIEHTLFKGTTHRRAHHIRTRIDGVGGEFSAFTTREETCFYTISLREHLPRCVELLSDLLFNATFPEAEIEKEKEVVLEEINYYNDSPSERIYDQFEECSFGQHPLAHPILGSKRNVRHFDSQRLRRRMEQCYTPQRMVIAVVGDVDMERLSRLCERHFGGYTRPGSTGPDLPPRTRPTVQQFDLHLHRRTHQSHLMLGCEAPDTYSPDKLAFALLNNLLGGSAMNSRLNVSVRERYGFCYIVESTFAPFTDTGLFFIYAGMDHQAEQRVLQLVRQELERVATTPLTPRQLQQAKQQFIGQMMIANDDGVGELENIGKAYLAFDRVDTLEQERDEVLRLTSDDLLRVAQRYLQPARLSTLLYS